MLASETVPSMATIPYRNILGIHFHCLSIAETLNVLDRFIEERRPRQISFSNAYTIALCEKNEDLKKIINQSDLTLADGMSVVWGARVLRQKLPERVAGPDLMNALSERAAEKGYRVFLLGTSDENLDQLKKKLCASWPGLNIVGVYSPPMCDKFDQDQTADIIKRVRMANPDILFVGLSCPKQERWIAENLEQIHVPVCLGVGAAFDFLAGRIPRAPEWLRRRGLEWIHRLWCEPGRLWRRYLIGNSVFIFILFRERIKFKFAKKRSSASS